MNSVFSLLGLALLLLVCIGGILLLVFLGRKLGFISPKMVDGVTESGGGFQPQINYKESKVIRYGLVGFLVALLSIPLAMVSDVVKERYGLYTGVQNEIAQTWGQTQYLSGPLLVIPYTEKFETEEIITDKHGNETRKNKTIYETWNAVVLPDALNIDVTLNEREKRRGIYASLVYQADLSISGNFILPDLSSFSKAVDQIHWDQAWLTLGVSDTQAINQVSSLKWGKQQNNFEFEPGAKVTSLVKKGFHAPLARDNIVALSDNQEQAYPFSLNLNINGSKSFNFSPFGKTTTATIQSKWPHPSFIGDFLPDTHDVSQQGFTASWSIPHLARSYPQFWTLGKQEYSVSNYTAGVNLYESVSLYSKITRAVKYGLLFVVLTYATLLIFEMGMGRGLHVIQYGVVGFALTLFYLILLSTAEHAGFLKAYFIAAASIVSMIGIYVSMALRSIIKGATVTLMLSGLYFLLFVMLRLEDYALVVGVSLLVCILAIAMYFTRNLNSQAELE